MAKKEYIYATGWKKEIRFDIVAVILRGEIFEIEHIIDAFY